ncbi:MAG: hypothetical protein KVP17_002851 [Porospora cf. gigantea B]|uniref:uncharacterized protein n=1 Tax=Porospora cf. gigantea B TaxID=2853592 RepID=UPI003571CB81|nr:MAG: hypothetical protein KVP17_002851 [Porospora cf. gigantea B]
MSGLQTIKRGVESRVSQAALDQWVAEVYGPTDPAAYLRRLMRVRQHWCLQKSNGLLLGAVEAKAGTWASTTSACVDRYMSLEVMAARVRHGVESPRSQRGPTLRQLSRYIETQLSVQHGCVCALLYLRYTNSGEANDWACACDIQGDTLAAIIDLWWRMIIGVDVVQCVVVDRQGFRFRRTDLRHAKPMRFRCLTPTHLSEADPEESSGETLQWRELNSLRETRLTAESSGDPKRQYRFYWPLPDEVASLETEESLEWVEPKGMGEYDGCVLDFGDRGSLPKLQKQGRKLRQQTLPRPIDGIDIVRKRSAWSKLRGNQKLLAAFLRCKERHPDDLVSLAEHVIDLDLTADPEVTFRQIMCLDGDATLVTSDLGRRQQAARISQSRLSSLGTVMSEQGLEPPSNMEDVEACFGKLDPGEKRRLLVALVVALETALQEKVFEREIQIVFRQLRRVLNTDGGEGFVVTAARLLETEVRLYVGNGVLKDTGEFVPAPTCVLIQRTNEICQRVPVTSPTVSDMTRTLIDNCDGCIVLEGWNMLLRKMAHSMASLFCLESKSVFLHKCARYDKAAAKLLIIRPFEERAPFVPPFSIMDWLVSHY